MTPHPESRKLVKITFLVITFFEQFFFAENLPKNAPKNGPKFYAFFGFDLFFFRFIFNIFFVE